jgi:hypothetical protein
MLIKVHIIPLVASVVVWAHKYFFRVRILGSVIMNYGSWIDTPVSKDADPGYLITELRILIQEANYLRIHQIRISTTAF